MIQRNLATTRGALVLIMFILAFLSSPLTGTAAAELPDQWVNYYSTAGVEGDWGIDVKVDATGEVYFIGNESFYADATIAVGKYHADGSPAWTQSYQVGACNNCQAKAMRLTDDGVVVVGSCYDNSIDGVIVSFDKSDGSVLWSDIYDGTDGLTDSFETLEVAASSGNIYVAGTSQTSGAGYNYLIRKYNSSGAAQWTTLNNGPGNDEDYVTGLALDDQENAYVNGTQTGTTNTTITLAKFNSSGVYQWRRNISGLVGADAWGGSVVVAPNGNIYFNGMVAASHAKADNYDIALSWVPADNSEVNTVLFNGDADLNDYTPNRYDFWYANGTDSRSLAVDDDGNLFIYGVSDWFINPDVFVAKYEEDGTLLWSETLSLTVDSDEQPGEMMLDDLGNAIITGSYDPGPDWNAYLIVLDGETGSQIGSPTTFNGPGSGDDAFIALDLEQGVNPVVVGFAYGGAATDYDMVVVEYCAGCLIDNVCVPDGNFNPANDCLLCDAATDQAAWTPAADGSACDDGEYCTDGDECASGACVPGPARDCDDGDFCTGTETCDETGDECVSSGDPCDADETCNETENTCDENADDDTVDDDTSDDDTVDDDDADDDHDDDDDDDDNDQGSGC